jgi:capsular polysaccharide biosynthesis protein
MRSPRFTPWLIVATLTAAGAAAALGYGLTAPKEYRATATMLVSPVSASDSSFAGLDVFRDASGRRTAAESAAALVKTPQVADAVRTQLGMRRSTGSLLAAIDAHVVHGSDVVEVTGRDSSGASASQLANAFVDALIAQRTSGFQSQLTSAIARDEQLLQATGPGAEANELARRLAVLRSLQGQADPTLHRAATATAPTDASSSKVWELVLLGAGIGLAAGAAVALALALVRRRSTSVYDPPMAQPVAQPTVEPGSDDAAAEALVERLEQRLAARESALAARERDLQARIDELRAIEAERPDLDARERELDERERGLEERVAAVTKRELAVARVAAARPEPPPAAPTAPRVQANGGFDLGILERLVEERGPSHPERLEEWQSYLFFLRDYAAADGTLPHSFDALVEETFRPLLVAAR